MRVLLIKPSSLGDVIHALPIAAALREHPGVEAVDWVINSDLAGWLIGNPDLTQVLPFPRKQWAHLYDFMLALRREEYDWVIDLQGLLRSSIISRTARGKRHIVIGDAREGAGLIGGEKAPVRKAHAIDRYCQVLEHLGVQIDELRFPLPPSPEMTDKVPSEYVLLHPHARWPTKILPQELVAQIVAALAPLPVIVAGQGQRYDLPGTLDFTNQTSVSQLLALLRKASVVISADSGPMHLAAALGRPLLALFGPTSPGLTGPWTSNSRVMQTSLGCVPCMSRQCRIAEERSCLRSLDVAQIAATVRELLAQGPAQKQTLSELRKQYESLQRS